MNKAHSCAYMEERISLHKANIGLQDVLFKKINVIIILFILFITSIAAAQTSSISGQIEVTDSISDIGEYVDLSLVKNSVYNQNGIAIWQLGLISTSHMQIN